MRTNIESIVPKQLPEFIREDYPAFVAFVQAYYTWLKAQELDLKETRDLDTTLDDYIQYFKKELAVHLPQLLEDERLVIPRIKELYLAKGSSQSYKLLFNLLYGKNVEIDYPGQQMLVASDGRWNQEISVFAKIEYGTADDVVGKLVDIVTASRVLRVLVDRKEQLHGEVDRIVALGDNVYEFFLDKRFFGKINVGDKIKYKDVFQAVILPATQSPTIVQPGKKFRIGQVFQINSGNGTGALLKVTETTKTGGIKYAELIKFGLGYTSDFAVNVLASNSVSTSVKQVQTTSTALSSSQVGSDHHYALTISDRLPGFSEQGYINAGDYVEWQYIDSTYAGTILREFSLNYLDAQITSDEPAIVSIKLGALVKYPGYYTTNNGFLDDSIKIQDSYFYQQFSYVLRIDERLESYKAAVKTLVHPTGMALFGEYTITNEFDLSIALDCVVKALGISLSDDFIINDDGTSLYFTKRLDDAIDQPDDSIFRMVVNKPLADTTVGTWTDLATKEFTKSLTETTIGTLVDTTTLNFTKSLNETIASTDAAPTFEVTKSLTDTPVITEVLTNSVAKYVEDTSVGTWSNAGKVWMNSYQAQDYYDEIYSEGFQTSFTN
jgi:hypothetical protein